MRTSMKCIRFVLFAFNLVFVMCGLVLIVVGAAATRMDLTEFMDNKYLSLPYLLIVVGCIIFLVAFFGCCGALKYSYLMVIIYALFILVIMVVEISGGIAAYIFKAKVGDFLLTSMNESLVQQRDDSVKIWDAVQSRLQCCGVVGASDYTKLELEVPNSCCEGKAKCNKEEAWKIGCFLRVLQVAKGSIEIIAFVAIGIAVVELLGCLFALCLAYAIINDDKEHAGNTIS